MLNKYVSGLLKANRSGKKFRLRIYLYIYLSIRAHRHKNTPKDPGEQKMAIIPATHFREKYSVEDICAFEAFDALLSLSLPVHFSSCYSFCTCR